MRYLVPIENGNIKVQSSKDFEFEFMRHVDVWSKKEGKSLASIPISFLYQDHMEYDPEGNRIRHSL